MLQQEYVLVFQLIQFLLVQVVRQILVHLELVLIKVIMVLIQQV